VSDEPSAEALEAVRRRFAHDIRNSLGAIRSAAELLQRRYKPEGRDLKLFEVILAEVARLSESVGKPPSS
jgi:nitrogen-specific signal transduction histidine kinase